MVLPRIGGRGELLPADGAEGRLGIGALGVYADTGAFFPHLPPLQPEGAAAVLHQLEARGAAPLPARLVRRIRGGDRYAALRAAASEGLVRRMAEPVLLVRHPRLDGRADEGGRCALGVRCRLLVPHAARRAFR